MKHRHSRRFVHSSIQGTVESVDCIQAVLCVTPGPCLRGEGHTRSYLQHWFVSRGVFWTEEWWIDSRDLLDLMCVFLFYTDLKCKKLRAQRQTFCEISLSTPCDQLAVKAWPHFLPCVGVLVPCDPPGHTKEHVAVPPWQPATSFRRPEQMSPPPPHSSITRLTRLELTRAN